MDDRTSTSIMFSRSLAKKVKQRGIDEDLNFSEAMHAAAESWLNAFESAERGESNLGHSPDDESPIAKTLADVHNTVDRLARDCQAVLRHLDRLIAELPHHAEQELADLLPASDDELAELGGIVKRLEDRHGIASEARPHRKQAAAREKKAGG